MTPMVIRLINFILLFIPLAGIIFTFPTFSFANGGDQRVVEGKYLINLSRSPFTPKTGDNVAMIASFFDIKKDQLITEDLIVKIRIAKLGKGRERKFLFEQENVKVKGGILEFQHAFAEPGLHEIFFDFAFSSNPQKVYNAPDFLLDIQKTSIQEISNLSFLLWIVLGIIVGFVGGWLINRSR